IRGKVTKFNSKIMNRNWIHLQDGTGNSGGFDFTATTSDEVNVGDIITIEGVITLEKDFGAGYFYDIIMESGKVIN
ncbi:MAG: nucleotide-binding protein, partial [Marinilabiliales bacterium]